MQSYTEEKKHKNSQSAKYISYRGKKLCANSPSFPLTPFFYPACCFWEAPFYSVLLWVHLNSTSECRWNHMVFVSLCLGYFSEHSICWDLYIRFQMEKIPNWHIPALYYYHFLFLSFVGIGLPPFPFPTNLAIVPWMVQWHGPSAVVLTRCVCRDVVGVSSGRE